MKLYAIRLENGEVVIISAESEQDALFQAGLDESAMGEIREQGLDHAAVVLSGLGLQRHEIVELKDFCIRMKLDELGDFEISELEEETADELYKLYPALESALSEAASRWPGLEVLSHRNEYRRLMDNARSRELARLMMPPGSE